MPNFLLCAPIGALFYARMTYNIGICQHATNFVKYLHFYTP